ncbi:general secretion pathway protein I [Limimaricola variabilis]|uniref:General secretion pathway protein I n=1 Tax=Limimaricola variabilis TaxID=1492771 RepID=A0ABR6HNG8_9RHOB|nr:type II secretion system protein [Limimaricola variabilis]MBB3711998.1 general secretion pathway protein I [Limimaricola variabilis]
MRSSAARNAATRRRATSGFTMLEVLLAFAMLTIVTGAVLGVTSSALQGSARRVERAWLVELARSVTEEHLATRGFVATVESLGQYEEWHWRIEERPAEPIVAMPGVALDGYVTVAVSVWNDAAPERVVTLESLVAERPAP